MLRNLGIYHYQLYFITCNLKLQRDIHEHTIEIGQYNNDESLSQQMISKKMIISYKEIKKEYNETSYTSIRDNAEGVKQMSTAPDGAIEVSL